MNWIKQNWISWGAGLLLTLAILGGLQYLGRGKFSDPDGFYHARSSQMLSSGQLDSWNSNQDFPWLFYTTWNDGYANQHYLYHWLLVPFNTLEKLPVSIVIFGLVFTTFFLATLWKYQVKFKWFWIFILFASSVDFLFRINLVKANGISLALLFIIVFLMHLWHLKQSKFSLLGIGLISGIFVWTYGGFICVPFLLGAYACAEIISERSFKLKSLAKAFLPVLVSVVGIIIGMVLHPQNHNLVTLLYDQLFRTGLGAGSVVPAGNEWLAFNLDWFFKSNVLILFAWLFSIGLFINAIFRDRKNADNKTLTIWLQITALGLMVLTLWHRRFVEYWVPFAVLASAVTLQPYLQKLQWSEVKKGFNHWQMKTGVVLIGIIVLIIGAWNLNNVAQSLRGGESADSFKSAAEWLEQNSEAGDIVLDTQWDQFPQLFYYNTKNYYVVGLDPTFMHIHDPDKYWQWRIIADDKPAQWESPKSVYDIIKKDLNSRFVFIDKSRNPDIYDFIVSNDQNNVYFKPGFDSENITIFILD